MEVGSNSCACEIVPAQINVSVMNDMMELIKIKQKLDYPDIFWDKGYWNHSKWWIQFSFVWRAIGINMKYADCGCDHGQFLCDRHASEWMRQYSKSPSAKIEQ